MSQISETICDQCSARKTKSNHWWSVWPSKVGFHVYPGSYDKNNSDFPEVQSHPARDICSEGCLLREFSDFIDGIRNSENDLEKAKTEVVKEFYESLVHNDLVREGIIK